MKEDKETYNSTHERLMAERYAPEQVLQFRAKVSVNENGKRYLLTTNGKEESVVYAVDGNIVKYYQRHNYPFFFFPDDNNSMLVKTMWWGISALESLGRR